MDDDDLENNVSLSAMEAELKPRVLETFNAIADDYKKLRRLQDQDIANRLENTKLSPSQDRKYKKLKDDIITAVKSLSLNNNRIEALVEQLYDINKRLIGHETRLLRLAESYGVGREDFLKQHVGGELDPKWVLRVSKLGSRGWKEFVAAELERIKQLREEVHTLASETGLEIQEFRKIDRGLLKRFDWLGLAGMAAFLGSLEYVLEEGTRLDWFESHEIVFFSVVMVFGAVLFFWRALTRDDPLVDLYAFRNRNFAFGSLFSFCMGIGLYGLTYLYPVYLGRIRGYDALMIGETMFVTGLAMFLTAPIAGRLSAKLDPRIMMIIGFSAFALGTWIVSHITADWDFYELLLPQILRGCGLMLCMVPINNVALGTLPPQQLKNASGLYNLTRNLGGAVGLAVINTMLNTRTDVHITRLHEWVAAGRQVAEEALANTAQRFGDFGDAANTMALALLNQRAHKQALIMAFGDVFLGLTAIFACLVVLSLFLSKPKPAPTGAGGGH